MTYKLPLLTLAIMSLLAVSAPGAVLASNGGDDSVNANSSVRLGNRSMQVQVNTVASTTGVKRCALIESAIDLKISLFDANKTRHVAAAQNLHDRFTALVSRLDAKGYDTAKLKADAEVLKAKLATLKTDYAAYIEALRTARLQACGQAGTKLGASLKNARQLLQTVRADAKDIRTYYQTTIRPDIKGLRLAGSATATTSASNQ